MRLPAIALVFPFLLGLQSLSGLYAAKILLIPGPHYGHVNFFSVAAKHLKKAGHEPWVLTADMFKGRLVKGGLSHILYDSAFIQELHDDLDKIIPGLITGESGYLDMFRAMSAKTPVVVYCKHLLENEENMKMIKEQNFDLAIIDGVPLARCSYVIPYKFGIKHITMTAVQEPWSAGVPSMPSFEPTQPIPFLESSMSFLQRTLNTLVYIGADVREMMEDTALDYVKQYVPDKPAVSLKYLHRASELWLVNLEPICLDYPRAALPHYHFLGGASVQPPKPLTGEVAKFVDGAEHGVIIMSFSSFKPFNHALVVVMDKLLEAFSKIKQRVIIQQEPERIKDFKIPSNVLPLAFLPQNDILGHPKTVLFITHCGNNGQMEAVYHGMPMLGLPLIIEQKYNAQRMVARGYGLALDISTFTADELVHAIHTIINNSTYAEKTQTCSKILRSLPSAGEKIIYWIDHVLQFGGAHLRPASLDMSTFHMLNLDVWVFLSVLLALILLGLFYLCRCCFRCFRKCCRNNADKPKRE